MSRFDFWFIKLWNRKNFIWNCINQWLRDCKNYNKKTFLLLSKNDVDDLFSKKTNFRYEIWMKMNCFDEISQFMCFSILSQKKIFRINHDDFDVEHFAQIRIIDVIRKKYFWFDMIKKITKYIHICSNCQKMRVHKHKSYDDLSSISFDEIQLFHTITINFIIDMSSTRDFYIDKINNAILMLIDKLIKYTIYLSTNKILISKNLQIWYDEILFIVIK